MCPKLIEEKRVGRLQYEMAFRDWVRPIANVIICHLFYCWGVMKLLHVPDQQVLEKYLHKVPKYLAEAKTIEEQNGNRKEKEIH